MNSLATIIDAHALAVQGKVLEAPFTGSVTSAKGFHAAAAHIGIKRKRKDLALLWSEVPANVACVFTTNVMKAAPIIWNQQVVAQSGKIHGIVINSGNANSCTGEQGLVNTEVMAKTYAACMGVDAKEILVCSTGVIGVQLPMEIITKGIISTSASMEHSPLAGQLAAEAIMTTDTYTKQISVVFEVDGKKVVLGAMAKGSGMIHPNMATMLSFITTDLNIAPHLLEKALKESTCDTYNMISVDGDTSTNDMVAIMANGLAGNTMIESEDDGYFAFCSALKTVNTHMAKVIVQDGEGATKFLEAQVANATSVDDARLLARSIVSSSLVKTAFFGEDANWGRIICAMGYSGAKFDPATVSISLKSAGGVINLLSGGEPVCVNEILAKQILAEKSIIIEVDMKSGESSATAWGCDLSYDYVRINGSYRT